MTHSQRRSRIKVHTLHLASADCSVERLFVADHIFARGSITGQGIDSGCAAVSERACESTHDLGRERRIPVWIVGQPSDDGSEPRIMTPVLVGVNMRFAVVRRLMVAGNRESSSPGIGAWAERYLAELFARLKGQA
jgi:hypothetical protein